MRGLPGEVVVEGRRPWRWQRAGQIGPAPSGQTVHGSVTARRGGGGVVGESTSAAPVDRAKSNHRPAGWTG